MSLKHRLASLYGRYCPEYLYQKATRLVFGAVFPIFVLVQFTDQGMTFPASLITLLTVLALVFTIISWDTLMMRMRLEERFDDEE